MRTQIMFRHKAIYVTIFLLVSLSSVCAEKSTELYIPIGKSPGLSGIYTVIGTIDQINSPNRTITLQTDSGGHTVILTERTFIYLDKSRVKQINTQGTLADCEPGDPIEVKWEDDNPAKPAEWIKVEKLR